MFVMHDLELRGRALDLIAAGVNDCEVGRRLGVARTTVRHWRWATERGAPPRSLCWRCWRSTRRVVVAAADYAELLGLYLGDGHISPMPRSERLRISLDARYPTIVAETDALLRRAFPDCRVGPVVVDGGSTVVLWVCHRHLSCLFPQHGPGKKHERPIELEPWQHGLVGAAPWAFVRGCIRSDCCSFVNRTGRYARVPQLVDGHPRDLRLDVRGGRPASAPVPRSRPALPPRRCCPTDGHCRGKIAKGRATLLVRKRLW
jgi:Homeodomain-like domain